MNKFGDRKSKTFCILPWIHMHTWPNGNVYPCCIVDFRENIGNLKENTLEELWNSEAMKYIRKSMLDGEKPNYCRKCYQQEDNGIESPRETANMKFNQHIDTITDNTDPYGHNSDFNLKYWDFRFSNLCNFKCRICGSGCSSKWYEDEVKLYGNSSNKSALTHIDDYSIKSLEYYIDKFANEVEEVYFAGGEPLIMDEHYFILEKLIASGRTDVKLRYNTNLSILKYKKWNLIDLWGKFAETTSDNVDVYASIDGIKEQAEYSRKGTKWSEIEENIKICLGLNIRFNISCTVSIFNVFEIPKIVDYLIDLGLHFENIRLDNILTFPDYYHINILPEELKQKAIENLNNHLENMTTAHRGYFTSKYNSIINYINSDDKDLVQGSREKLLDYTTKLDAIRQESFTTVFPYYKEWITTLKTIK